MSLRFKFVFLFIIIFPFISSAQDNEEGQRPKYAPWGEKHKNMSDEKGKQGEWRYYTRDRILLYSITYKNDVKHGPSTKYYSSNGIVREEANFYYGIRDGEYKSYHSNGQLSAEGSYKENKKTGSWITYYKSSGEKKSEGSYLGNKKDGLWSYYNSKGIKIMQGSFKAGEKEGEWTVYDSDGKVTEISKYSNGVLQLKESADTSTKKKSSTNKTSTNTKKKPTINKTETNTKSDSTKTITKPKGN